ncbi:hypothetical protein C0989_002510 [Termitomyces sp. Mn162]|nr:hypothetical protein C0989_002510 [Termitomyces sp. Mn162]
MALQAQTQSRLDQEQDLLDPPPLAFSHREALYEDNQSGSRALEKEYRGEFRGTLNSEFLNKAVEVEDQIYTTTLHLPLSTMEIWEFQNIVLPYLHAFEDVFSKALFDSLLEHKQWDYTIELLLDSILSS